MNTAPPENLPTWTESNRDRAKIKKAAKLSRSNLMWLLTSNTLQKEGGLHTVGAAGPEVRSSGPESQVTRPKNGDLGQNNIT